jgi:hypothetical protein
MDIVVYTNEEVLEHKRRDGGVYWEFSRMPKNIKVGDRIFFAVKGFVKGSFRINYIDSEVYKEIDFGSGGWKSLKKKVQCKPFRSFRYKWW